MTVKRTLDVVFAGTGLVLSAPVWLVIAVLSKLQDGGPIFYGQMRVGWKGRPFHAWKFRSMTPDAEQTTGPVQAVEHDPRVTPLGRVLRATAMDELPQLWNIFRGDMSLVGPRALRPGEIEVRGNGTMVPANLIVGFAERCEVRPGLTGLAQLYAPRDVSRRSKFRYDRLYVQRQSLGLDLRLIAVSFWISLRGSWENRERKF
jgi:lipopolysaccharide/colanic/teichoic acid biosynthesis glycosyltransferase